MCARAVDALRGHARITSSITANHRVFPSLSHPRSSGAKRTTGEINSSNRGWTESFDPGPLNYSRSILDDDGSVQEILVVEILTLIVGSSGYILGWEGRVCVWGSSLG